MMRTPDGHGRLELSRFLTPPAVADDRNAPVNALGYLRVMFAVGDIDETLERLRKRGAELVGEVVQYKDAYRILIPIVGVWATAIAWTAILMLLFEEVDSIGRLQAFAISAGVNLCFMAFQFAMGMRR
jgi:hypothetical protein